MRLAVLLATVLFFASCQRSAIDPSESLVGAKQLPSRQALSRETIEINFGFGDISPGFLSYQLRPDNKLVISLTDRNREPDSVLIEETFQLTSMTAAKARKMLWRVRPQEMQGMEWQTRPLGCELQGPHDFGQLAVVFDTEAPGVDLDDRLGIFELPRPESCRSREAVEARKLMQEVLRTFPASKAPVEFERRRAAKFD